MSPQDHIAPPGDAPPAGEGVHLPGPTLVPIVTAFGVSLALVGVVMNLLLVVVGVVITLWATIRWIADTRRDIAELPAEHRH
jgi:hypothetical protein